MSIHYLLSYPPDMVQGRQSLRLTLNFLVAVVNSLNTKTHSSKEMAEFCFEIADDKSMWYCKQRMKGTLSLSSECVETKLCKPCTSFTSHLHSWCGMVWYRTELTSHLHSWCGMVWYRTVNVPPTQLVWNGVV